MSHSPRKEPAPTHWLLRRADQAVVAVLVLAALAATVGWWVSQGGLQGRLIEVERARPRTPTFQLDINTVSWPELAQLPGIGDNLAQRIVASRQADGPFLDHQDVARRVKGIGPGKLDDIRPYLLPLPDAKNPAGE